MTPKTKAIPIPTGKATAIPATAMEADKSILAALKMTPPKNALPMFDKVACDKSSKKLRPSLPILPNVNAEMREKMSIPIT